MAPNRCRAPLVHVLEEKVSKEKSGAGKKAKAVAKRSQHVEITW